MRRRDAHPLGLGGDVLNLLAVGVDVRSARLAVAHVADSYESMVVEALGSASGSAPFAESAR
jgi:hypothetical protein